MAGQINGIIYVAGGYNSLGSSPSSTLQAYNPVTNTWSTLASMPAATQAGVAGVINGQLYVAGGQISGYTPVANLYAYNPATNSWTQLASMPQACADGAAGVIDSKLYVTCPYPGTFGTTIFDVYDPVANSWTALADSLKSHSLAATAVINGQFYVAGGDSPLRGFTEVYNPATNAWTRLANMRTPVGYTNGVELDGRLYALGGQNGSCPATPIAQYYDPTINKWKSLAMPTEQELSAPAVVYGIAFVLGGGTCSGIAGFSQDDVVTPSIP
jgi:N-acetylneuraminic acid mutarotase